MVAANQICQRHRAEGSSLAVRESRIESRLSEYREMEHEKPRPKSNRVPIPWDYTMSQEARLAPNVTRMVCAEAEQARTAEVESRSLQSTARAKQT